MPSDNIFYSDMHVHATQNRLKVAGTMIADALMNVENIASKAAEIGLHTLGIMEHVEPISERHPWEEALHVKKLVDQLKNRVPFKLLSGCEASIIDLKGNLSASCEDLKKVKFDYVIASVHSTFPENPKSIEEFQILAMGMMKKAIRHNPLIDIIGHPWRDTPKILKRCGIDTQWNYDLIPSEDIAELAELAANANIALEISRPAFEMPGYWNFLSTAAKAGAIFTIGSDAHQWDRFTLISNEEIELLKKAGISSKNLKVW